MSTINLSAAQWLILRAECAGASLDVMETYGLTLSGGRLLERLDPPASPVAAQLDFTGEQLGGSLYLVCSREVVERSYPLHGPDYEPVEHDAMQDWVGELSNQLLGRVKNRLVPYGVRILLNTPLALPAACLAEHLGAEAQGPPALALWQHFLGAGHPVWVRLVAHAFCDKILLADPIPDSGTAEEGSLELF